MGIVANDIVEVKTVCTEDNQFGMNVFSFQVLTAPTAALTDQELADAISTLFGNFLCPMIRVDASYAGCYMRYWHLGTWGPQTNSTDGAAAGSDPGTKLPDQVTGLITKKTTYGGRAGRGRIYVPFPSQARLDADNTPTLAYVGLLQTQFTWLLVPTVWLSVTPASTWSMQLIIHNEAMTSFKPVTGFVYRKKWATQRRRGNYGKLNPTFP